MGKSARIFSASYTALLSPTSSPPADFNAFGVEGDVDVADRDAAKLWIIRNQLGRRNLHDYDRNLLAEKRRAIIEESQPKVGRPRGAEDGRPGDSNAPFGEDAKPRLRSGEVSEPSHKRTTDARLAEIADTSRDSVRKHRTIAEHGAEHGEERIADGLRGGAFSTDCAYHLVRVGRECGPETYDALWQHGEEDARVRFSTPQLRHLLELSENGNGDEVTADLVQIVESGQPSPKTGKPITSVVAAHELRQQERDRARFEERRASHRATLRATPLPKRKYEIIYADPPWQYEHDVTPSRSVENHFPTMTLEKIMVLDVPADKQAMLFLWCPVPLLKGGIAVVEAWGFDYRTSLVWNKQKMRKGYYVRQQCEMLLVGRRGGYPVPPESARPRSLISEPPGRHSENPVSVYETLESMYPGSVRLELFARGEGREGWDSWGNEALDALPDALHASHEREVAS